MQDLADADSDEHAALSPHAAFGAFEKSLQSNQSGFIEQNIRLYEPFERLMGFQHDVNGKVAAKHFESANCWRTRRVPDNLHTEVFLSGTLNQNTQYLFSAWRTLEYGLFYVSASLLRTVFESVPKSFYLMARPDTVRTFKLDEMYLTWKSKNPKSKPRDTIPEFLKSPSARKTLGEKITPKDFAKFSREHRSSSIRKEIYNEDTFRLQNKLYSALSASSHPSLSRLHTPQQAFAASKRLPKIITDLSFFNLFLTINSQSRLLQDMGLMEAATRFIVQAKQDLGPYDELTNLYPDNDEYLDNLTLKPLP